MHDATKAGEGEPGGMSRDGPSTTREQRFTRLFRPVQTVQPFGRGRPHATSSTRRSTRVMLPPV